VESHAHVGKETQISRFDLLTEEGKLASALYYNLTYAFALAWFTNNPRPVLSWWFCEELRYIIGRRIGGEWSNKRTDLLKQATERGAHFARSMLCFSSHESLSTLFARSSSLCTSCKNSIRPRTSNRTPSFLCEILNPLFYSLD
jgi:hypothetical protein